MVLCRWDSYLNTPADFYGVYSLGRTILERVSLNKLYDMIHVFVVLLMPENIFGFIVH